MKYHVVAAVDELSITPQMHVQIDDREILLCRDGDEYFAVGYYCSHAEFTLEGGSIQNRCITCPYHGAEFDLRTGDALSAPAFEPIATYPVRLEENAIAIGIED